METNTNQIENQIKIKLKRSISGKKKNQIATAKSIGLKKINDITCQPNNSQTQGKIGVIKHLVEIIN